MDTKTIFEEQLSNVEKFMNDAVMLYEDRNGVELAVFLAVVRASNMIHQSHHWQARGSSYYGDHLMFERLYDKSVGDIDVVAEKLVGLLSSKETNFFIQVEHMKNFMQLVSKGESLVKESMVTEVCLILLGELTLKRLEKQGLLTEGLNQAIGNILDKHEDFLYLLKQRLSE